ncbi:MAG: FAD-dependent oxidoreductase [Motiliproteus sp.]
MSTGTETRPLKAAIIGSGPSGFYAAEGLLKRDGLNVEVDMFEYLPTPFGLVRAGVAPDHQSIKSISNIYERIAQLDNFNFWGNVEFGRDISIEELEARYDLVIFALGAQSDRALCIPGENLQGCHSATAFVGWYNGHPDYRDYPVDLSGKRAVIIGMGNVATDIARILALSPAEMAQTDLPDYAVEALLNSQIEEIEIVARRGPLQAAFTPVGVRKFTMLEQAVACVDPAELQLEAASQALLEQTQDKRLLNNLAFLNKISAHRPGSKKRCIRFLFRRSPVEIIGSGGQVQGVKLAKNELFEDDFGNLKLSLSQACETHPAGLVFNSIGYQVEPIAGVQLDPGRGVIANREGRLIDLATDRVIPRRYVVGWAKRGANGVIGTNKKDSLATLAHLFEDLDQYSMPAAERPLAEDTAQWLTGKGVRFVRFEEWQRIDAAELSLGDRQGKPREKITSVQQMMEMLTLK